MQRIPPELLSYHGRDGRVGGLVQCLTAYLPNVSVDQLSFLLDWYQRICPADRILKYAIAELQMWDDVATPYLTKQGLQAEAAGERWPFLAPVRTRITANRPFHLLFWDGNYDAMYAFTLRRVRDEERKQYTFVSVVLPVDADPSVMLSAARELADNVELYSGHGGYSFGYDANAAYQAFTQIYPRARRYWGVDVDGMNETLPLMGDAIKGINWLTLVGPKFYEVLLATGDISKPVHPLVTQERRANAILYRIGDAPDLGDIHRPSAELDAMHALGTRLSSIVVQDHPSFIGDGFIDNANTNGWIHRFDDPSGWR